MLRPLLAFFFALFANTVHAHELQGTRNGTYYCGQGVTSFRLVLDGENIDDWVISGTFEFFPH